MVISSRTFNATLSFIVNNRRWATRSLKWIRIQGHNQSSTEFLHGTKIQDKQERTERLRNNILSTYLPQYTGNLGKNSATFELGVRHSISKVNVAAGCRKEFSHQPAMSLTQTTFTNSLRFNYPVKKKSLTIEKLGLHHVAFRYCFENDTHKPNLTKGTDFPGAIF